MQHAYFSTSSSHLWIRFGWKFGRALGLAALSGTTGGRDAGLATHNMAHGTVKLKVWSSRNLCISRNSWHFCADFEATLKRLSLVFPAFISILVSSQSFWKSKPGLWLSRRSFWAAVIAAHHCLGIGLREIAAEALLCNQWMRDRIRVIENNFRHIFNIFVMFPYVSDSHQKRVPEFHWPRQSKTHQLPRRVLGPRVFQTFWIA